jgi:hypothetical protein
VVRADRITDPLFFDEDIITSSSFLYKLNFYVWGYGEY